MKNKTLSLTLFALLLCLPASAESITKIFPKLGSTNFLNGTTNFIAGNSVSNYFVAVITTTIYTNPAITLSNGASVAITGYVTNFSTNVPGLLTLDRYDNTEVCLSFCGAPTGVVSNTATAVFYKTMDGTTNNACPAFTLTCGTASGINGATYSVSTNYPIGAAYGLILWNITLSGTNYATNILVQANGKAIRSGP